MSKGGKKVYDKGTTKPSRPAIDWNLLDKPSTKGKKEEMASKSKGEYWDTEEQDLKASVAKKVSANGVPLGRKAIPWAEKPENKLAVDLFNQINDGLTAEREKAKNSKVRASDDDLLMSIKKSIDKADSVALQNLKAEITARMHAQTTTNEEKKRKVMELKQQLNFSSEFSFDSHSAFLKAMSNMSGRKILANQQLLEVATQILEYKASIDETMKPVLRDHRLLMQGIIDKEMSQYTKSNALFISQDIDYGVDDGFEVEEEEVKPPPAKVQRTSAIPSMTSSSSSSSSSAGFNRIIPSGNAEEATNKALETMANASKLGNLDDFEEDEE